MTTTTTVHRAEATWNPIVRCRNAETRGEAVCPYCFALREQHSSRAERQRYLAGGFHLLEHVIEEPSRWRIPRQITICESLDVFRHVIPDHFLDTIWSVMARCPQHTFSLRTRFAERMYEYLRSRRKPALPNLWLGVSVQGQKDVLQRLPFLLSTEATVRFLACQPDCRPFRFPAGVDGRRLHRCVLARQNTKSMQAGLIWMCKKLDIAFSIIDWTAEDRRWIRRTPPAEREAPHVAP